MATASKTQKDQATVAGLMLAVVIGYLVFSSSGAPAPQPPGPTPAAATLESATVAVLSLQASGYSEAFRDAASEIGVSITTEQELLTYLAETTKSVRETAKSSFDQQLELALPFDGEIPPEHFEYVRSVLLRVSNSFAKGR